MATKNHGHQQGIMVTKRNLRGSIAENDFQCLFINLFAYNWSALFCHDTTKSVSEALFSWIKIYFSLEIDLQLQWRLKWPSITVILGNGFWVQLDGN
jgi:hypothetical protein